MGHEQPSNLLSRLRRSLWAAGGARAALAALIILVSALGLMRLVATAPPLPSSLPEVPAAPADSADSADTTGKAAVDSATEHPELEGERPGSEPTGSQGAGRVIRREGEEEMDDAGFEPATPTMSR